MHALSRTLLAAALALVSQNAFARGDKNGWFQFSLDGGATWLAHAPPLDLGSDSGTTFNVLRGVSIPVRDTSWFGGGSLDIRAGSKRESWFLPLFGARIAIADFHVQMANGQNVTTTLDQLMYSEMFLPGIGWRFGDTLSLSARPVYVRLDTSGSATDGHVTTAVSAGTDGFGVLGDVQLCVGELFHACAFAEPTVMWMSGPDFALTFGVRVALSPSLTPRARPD